MAGTSFRGRNTGRDSARFYSAADAMVAGNWAASAPANLRAFAS